MWYYHLIAALRRVEDNRLGRLIDLARDALGTFEPARDVVDDSAAAV